ncbi:hypothetical protein GJAV_G00094010 [Gymnothorax javanicus]|nr:hypothetical protein GJAV_G00094010 [Gymnothorax javanicus]
MSNCVNYQTQIASIMNILSKAAVAEISKVVDDGFVLLRLEMCRKENEIESLKMKIQSLESELRTTGGLGEQASVYNRSVHLGIRLRGPRKKPLDCSTGGRKETAGDHGLFENNRDEQRTLQRGEQIEQPTSVDGGKMLETESKAAGDPNELESALGQDWGFSLESDGQPAHVEEVDSPFQSGIVQNQPADVEKVRAGPVLIKQERVEEGFCYSDPQSTSSGVEQVLQPIPVEDGKKLDSEPSSLGDPEELSCGLGTEEISGLEFVVKAEPEEHVAQRLNQTGCERSIGRLNTLDSEYVMYERDNQVWTSFTQGNSDIESDDMVCSNATEECSQSLSIHSALHHIPATTEVAGSTLSFIGASCAEEFDKMGEKLRSEAIHTQQGQYRERLEHTVERENQTLLPQQQQHGPSVKHMRGSESPAQPHSGSQYETGSTLSSGVLSIRGKMTAQLASIMEVLAKAAVAEISKLVEDGSVILRLEVSRSHKEIDCLKRKLQLVESELRTAQEAATHDNRSIGVQVEDQFGEGVAVREETAEKRHPFEHKHCEEDSGAQSCNTRPVFGFTVKAEQEEEHVAQRLNQAGCEHSAGRLNTLDSEYGMYERDIQKWNSFPQGNCNIEINDPVCSNATELCSQGLTVNSPLQHTPATMEVSGSTLFLENDGYVVDGDVVKEEAVLNARSSEEAAPPQLRRRARGPRHRNYRDKRTTEQKPPVQPPDRAPSTPPKPLTSSPSGIKRAATPSTPTPSPGSGHPAPEPHIPGPDKIPAAPAPREPQNRSAAGPTPKRGTEGARGLTEVNQRPPDCRPISRHRPSPSAKADTRVTTGPARRPPIINLYFMT